MIDKTFYTDNRRKLCEQMEGYLLVIPAHSLLQYSGDLPYPFRQDSTFWYLTGLAEPDCLLLINTKNCRSTLLTPAQNKYQKEWDGVLSREDLEERSGITEFGSVVSLRSRLAAAKKSGLRIGYVKSLPERLEPYGFYTNPARRRVAAVVRSVDRKADDIRVTIARLRQVKQQCEIDAIQTAINITDKTLEDVKSRLDQFDSEKDVERAISAGFYAHGGDGHAYEPIVASGSNAAIIHYQKNNDTLKQNELLLLDVGASYSGYAADISRTWAVGKLSARQSELIAMVADIQNKAISMLKPGVFVKEYQQKMEKYADKLQQKHAINVAKYPHGFSHFLGLDVHDAGDYDTPLQPGVVMTVEPGVYLLGEGIGIRIEDNVLITDKGCRVLSGSIPKSL